MKKKETRKKVVSQEYELGTRCDLCGVWDRAGPGQEPVTDTYWNRDWGDSVTITVEAKKEVLYPECTGCSKLIVDVCPNCFHSKLLEWLKEQGAEPRIERRYHGRKYRTRNPART